MISAEGVDPLNPGDGTERGEPGAPCPVEAELYELAYYASAPRDDNLIEFISGLLSEKAPGRHVLDCACGTGEPALWLSPRFLVTLSDASGAMLEIAERKAERHGVQDVRFQVAEWESLPVHVSGRFDAVLCTGNALAQTLSREARRSALAGMHAVLGPGGLLYLDFREDYPDSPPHSFVPVELVSPLEWEGRNLVGMVFEGRFPPRIKRLKDYYHVAPGQASLVASIASEYLPFTRTEIEEDLAAVGFSHAAFHSRPGRWPMTAVTAIRSS